MNSSMAFSFFSLRYIHIIYDLARVRSSCSRPYTVPYQNGVKGGSSGIKNPLKARMALATVYLAGSESVKSRWSRISAEGDSLARRQSCGISLYLRPLADICGILFTDP